MRTKAAWESEAARMEDTKRRRNMRISYWKRADRGVGCGPGGPPHILLHQFPNGLEEDRRSYGLDHDARNQLLFGLAVKVARPSGEDDHRHTASHLANA